MLPRGRDFVVRRKFVEELDVGGERGAREDTFEQIVTQQGVLPDLARQHRLKRVQIVNSLPGVRTLVKQILINIGNRRSVWIDSARPGKNSLEERAFAIGGKRRRHARLHDAVAVHHAAQFRAHLRPVQRVRHGSHQARRGAARKARIRIQGDDVANHRNGVRHPAADGNEIGLRRAAQQLVQLVQLSPLALPAHPFLLAFVPGALAVEQEEARAASRSRAVGFVQAGDAAGSCGQ